jgi:hypothetical protein
MLIRMMSTSRNLRGALRSLMEHSLKQFVLKLAWLASEEEPHNSDMRISLRAFPKFRQRRRPLSTTMHDNLFAYMFQ